MKDFCFLARNTLTVAWHTEWSLCYCFHFISKIVCPKIFCRWLYFNQINSFVEGILFEVLSQCNILSYIFSFSIGSFNWIPVIGAQTVHFMKIRRILSPKTIHIPCWFLFPSFQSQKVISFLRYFFFPRSSLSLNSFAFDYLNNRLITTFYLRGKSKCCLGLRSIFVEVFQPTFRIM